MLDAPFTRRQPAPWTKAAGLPAVLERWRRDPELAGSFVLDTTLPGNEAALAPVPADLAPGLARALGLRGIDRLYTHQARALQLAREGRDVVIATPTASGKSLAYNLPVLDHLARTPDARAIYLFPTKALARDQEAALRALMRDAELDRGAVTYDGDTPQDARRAAREKSAILITNPDMLHAGVLPHHAAWARLFANLAYVVVDELHTYRGVFGSHLANVLRRLARIAAFHGSEVRFLFSSATIGNPRAHASALLGRDVEAVEESGAPSGARHVLVYNPPVVNRELGIRASYTKSAVRLAANLVAADVSTIVFGQSRNQVEVMLKYLRDHDVVDADRVQAYRGGYLADTRRRIEHGLREGQVRCVVATNALELGIDIGALDAVICAGYPGSMASLWQRFGRGGRRFGESVAVLVTSSAPLDQYLARAPDHVIEAPVEHARIDPDNIEILLQHLKCGAFELPFSEDETFGAVPEGAVGQALDFLAENGVVHPVRKEGRKATFHWSSETYPASHVSLRNVGWDNFAIIDVEHTRTIAEMDFRSTHTMLHEQAIYQHEGEQYQVERLDFDNHKAYVRKVAPDYYTTAMTNTRINVLQEDARAEASAALEMAYGEVNVVEKVVGYKKIKFHTHENVGYGEVTLPEMQMPTTAVWISFPHELIEAVRAPRAVVIDGLRGVAHAMHTVAAIGLMMDPHDLGVALVDRFDRAGEGDPFDPTIYLYDHVAGGIGLAPRLFEERADLLVRAARSIASCPCEAGCPACVGVVIGAEGDGKKRIALAALELAGIAPWT